MTGDRRSLFNGRGVHFSHAGGAAQGGARAQDALVEPHCPDQPPGVPAAGLSDQAQIHRFSVDPGVSYGMQSHVYSHHR